jgi:hypothetical protein
MTTINPASVPVLRDRIRTVFGPLLVGLIGGGAVGGAALLSFLVLLRNCAATYAHFPSLPSPLLAVDATLPNWLVGLLAVLGIALPFTMGLATIWLVRPADFWADVSAGLTTALASTLSSLAAGIGWGAVLAMAVVPSIADLTWLGNATRTPAGVEGQAAHPSGSLVEHYPDLADQPADERGGRFMAKIVADQVLGSAWGVWLGLVLALSTCGALGFCSTLAAGYLWRRGGSVRAVVLPYLELTVSTSLLIGLLFREYTFNAGLVAGAAKMQIALLLWLAWLTVVIVLAVVQRWRWTVRLALAITWGVVFWQSAGYWVPWYLAGAAYLGSGILLIQHWLGRQSNALPAAA